ncbi:NAD(P)/FAD-dependent oxidoreductase [Plantactinospora endophytica]|uniref:Halogenase n=1 Tax=Plantactinospora endophytica TaxID=673535 RepID=A0ABQ4EBG2_9ACTN|nr:tryptophan 7-halogenase [Plantactinospora endophytica]GIG92077.1 halogenase [Plantactinospora endophytica]
MTSVSSRVDGNFDVIVLGSGIAGSVLGAVLARNGASVLLLDAGVHPRFAVGESTTLYTLNVFRILAKRYDVPEIEAFCSFEGCLDAIGSSFGTKRHFGFMLHTEGAEPDPREVNQFSPPSAQLQTSHLHRQDSDSYLFHTAISYGCTARQAFRVVETELDDDGVTVVGHTGERYRGRYLVDGSGFRSPIAGKLGLRAGPEALKHHSRSLFTHMVNVRPTDECLRMPAAEMPPIPWVQGTMHHIIDRGWFWIIPFNNEPRSKNPLVSIGLTFDERRYPKPADLSPEEEFRGYVARYPVLERIFADARTVRPWVSTDRLQYTSTQTIGPRWCLLSHAAGFIDPLYSRGLTNTGEVINSLAWRLLAALKDDDFSTERFQYVDDLQKGLIKYNDELVNASFVSFSNYELWNAVYRVWGAAEIPINLRFGQYLDRYLDSRDERVLIEMEEVPFLGHLLPDNPDYVRLFDEMVRLTDAVDRGELDAGVAGRELMATVSASPAVVRSVGLDDRDERFIYPQPEQLAQMVRQLAATGPEHMRYLTRRPRFAQVLPKAAG